MSWSTVDENDDDHIDYMKINVTMRTQRPWNLAATALRGARGAVKSKLLAVIPTILILALAIAAAEEPVTVTWNPLGPMKVEADTLLLADLASAESVEKQGGFALGVWQERKPAGEVYDFGPGRSGPSFHGTVGAYTFHQYPCDGLVPGDEFTIEFSFRADQAWADMCSGRGFFSIIGGNLLDVYNDKHVLVITAGTDKKPGSRRLELAVNKWSLDDRKWHALGFTWKDGLLKVWLDGKATGELKDLPWGPLWSDSTHSDGILIGGAPGISKGWLWVSDLRISRTARIPGEAVPLRPLRGRIALDLTQTAGVLPPHLLGALHPTTSAKPGTITQALYVIRTDKLLVATPMVRGAPDATRQTKGISGRFAYDWQVCDRTFDWMKAQGVLPFISIDATPQMLGGSVPPFAGEQLKTLMCHASGFGPNPPDSLDDWAAIVGDLVHHILKERKETVPWWGVWNEPADTNSFWKAGLDAYLDLYAVTVKAVREIDPAAKVGGPEVASPWEAEKGRYWIQALIERCAKDKLPLDFISYHDYDGTLLMPGLVQAKVAEWSKTAGLAKPPAIILGEFQWALENAYRTGKPQFSQGMWHLRSLNAAYTIAMLSRLVELGGFELLTFSHTSYGNPRNGNNESLQLIGPNGERWAPFNALAGWKSVMVGELLKPVSDLPPGVFVAASHDAKTKHTGVVLSNYGFTQRQARKVTLTIAHPDSGSLRLTRWLVDATHSSRWDLAEDRPEGAAQDSLAQVEQKLLSVKGGSVVLELDLPANSATFIAIEPAK